MKHIAQAVRLYESFREKKPRRIADIKLKVPKAVACIGYVEGIDYRTTHGKKVTLYHHDFAPGSRPLLAVSGDGKQLLLLGGRYEFTERGIVDKDAAGREIENAQHGKTINPRAKTFGDLSIGETFDFVDPTAGTRNSFYLRCRKVSARGYVDSEGVRHTVGSVRSKVFHVGEGRHSNPVQTLEEDAATVLRVTQRESAHFEALRAGKALATDLPARTAAEWDAFRRYQRSMTRLAKDAFK